MVLPLFIDITGVLSGSNILNYLKIAPTRPEKKILIDYFVKISEFSIKEFF